MLTERELSTRGQWEKLEQLMLSLEQRAQIILQESQAVIAAVRQALSSLESNAPPRVPQLSPQLEQQRESRMIQNIRNAKSAYRRQKIKLPEFPDRIYREVESIMFSGLLGRSSLRRVQIAILGVLLERNGEPLSPQEFCERTKYAKGSVYVAVSNLSRKLAFATTNVEYHSRGKVMQLVHYPKTPVVDPDPATVQQLHEIIEKYAECEGYTAELSTESVSTLLKRGFAYLIQERAKGSTAISYQDIMDAVGRHLPVSCAPEYVVWYLSTRLPAEWGAKDNWSDEVLRLRPSYPK